MPEQTSGGFQPNKITTNGATLWDESGMMLRLSYLDESFSIQISTPFVSETGKKTYPEKNRHNLLLTADRAAALYHEVILNQILPAYERGENLSKGVFLNRGKTAILEVRVQDGEFYLIYYKDIDEDRKAKSNYAFHFAKTDLIEDYKFETGEFAGQRSADGWFYIFAKYLEMGIYELCKPSGHAVRAATSYTVTAIFNYLKSISQKLGVVVEPAYRRNSGFNTPNAGMNAPTDEEIPFDNAPTVEEVAPTDMAGMLA